MPRAPDLAGRALEGRYELREMLGEGTFGRVYRGFDRRLGRAVAVKVIKPWWAEDSAWVERFQREAHLLARVSDPGVVQIFDIGDAEEGPYYVAELVEGESLAQRLRSGRLSVEQSRAVAEHLCRSLASAHREGVVHCDVKPANVLLGVGGSVKVGDFGVARLAEASSVVPSPTMAGTPLYMSPEQARGRPPTPATDVYSTGVVLYEMLAGKPPFRDGSPVELGLQHLKDPPPELPASVPRPLREVVARALAKDPAARYPDAGAMAEALAASRAPGSEPAAPIARQRSTDGGSARAEHPAGPPTAPTAIAGARRAGGNEEDGGGSDGVAGTRVLPAGPARAPREIHRALPTPGLRILVAGASLLLLAALVGIVRVLSAGASRTTVPELRQLPRGGVEARARRLHVRPAFSRRFAAAEAGIAIAQAPAAGTRVADGSTVHVVLSAGPPPVAVPGVVGEPAATAESTIAGAGLRYGSSAVAAPGSEPGVVVGQAPSPQASVPRGSTVALSISETPTWRPLTTFAGVDDGESVPFRILGSRWRVAYSMAFRETCLLIVVCGGPSAKARNLGTGSNAGGFELEEGESQTHVFTTGPGLYRVLVSGGRDSARWSMTVEDYY